MATVTSRSETYVTDDLACAVYLALLGYPYELGRKEPGNTGLAALWTFKDSDGRLQIEVREFGQGNARVEPTAYFRKSSEIRRTLYAYLDDE